MKNLGKKLNSPALAPKLHCSIINSFIRKHKIPLIPPLLFQEAFITDFTDKANLFNIFFTSQCTVLNNSSVLPPFSSVTDAKLDSLDINVVLIKKILMSLNPHKAHGWDNISVQMVKICGDLIVTPLKISFDNCTFQSLYPSTWKRSNVIQIHKKGSKSDITKYRSISLLPIFSKIFKKVIYNAFFSNLESNHLLSRNQSGFRPGDSCVSQLLSRTYNIYYPFDCNPSLEARGVFLDISKAFDKVWHKGLLFKLQQHGIS